MIYTISNDSLIVDVSSSGAELQSVRSVTGNEYLWQGDPEIWSGRAPNLFPFVARLHDGMYSLDGKQYEMKIHGFVKSMELSCVEHSENIIVFELLSNEGISSLMRFKTSLDGRNSPEEWPIAANPFKLPEATQRCFPVRSTGSISLIIWTAK